jgi:chromosomal replication initiator protein
MAIVRRKAELMNIDVSNEVVDFIARNFRNNIRELEGALLSTKAYADVMGAPVSLGVAREALQQALRPIGPGITMDRIVEVVCDHFEARSEDIRSRRRHRSVSEPRQTAWFLARRLTRLSLGEIGQHFGGRDHSTILYGVRRSEDRYRQGGTYASVLDSLADRLGGRLDPESPPA